MIIHIALFKWRSEVPREAVEAALEEVRALKQKVHGLREIYCGENFSPWAEGYTTAVVVVATNRESLDSYRKHPDHKVVAQRIESMEEKSLGVDFES